MELISSRIAIETLEYLHDLLSQPEHKERRGHIRAMIEAYRASEVNEKEAQSIKKTTINHYIPPGL